MTTKNCSSYKKMSCSADTKYPPFNILVDRASTVKIVLYGIESTDIKYTTTFVNFGISDKYIQPKTQTSINFEKYEEYNEPTNRNYHIAVHPYQTVSMYSEDRDVSGNQAFVDLKFAPNGSVIFLDYREIDLPDIPDSSSEDSTGDLNDTEVSTPSIIDSGDSVSSETDSVDNFSSDFLQFGPRVDIKRNVVLFEDYHFKNRKVTIEKTLIYRPFSRAMPFIFNSNV